MFACVQYVKNYDGDTVTFNIPGVHPLLGKNIAVRVDGIDTAEVKTKSHCEKQAARMARRLVANVLGRAKRIDLKNIKRGKYFRVVADVVYDGQNLKDILVKNRLAYKYDGGRKPAMDWCAIGREPSH
ncbi:MAG: thermonuclease family protein [Pseudobdellovibrionaceae bacterium]|nr:MAG: thermonuclease family protein [Pseudobdellovibrionaceae bacterium]